MDGKHARNTGQSSPLGQLFDHGVDVINLFLTMFLYFQASGYSVEGSPLIMPTMMLGPALFFSAQWEEWHSRICKHAVGGVLGVTEVQLLVVGSIMLPGFGISPNGVTMEHIFGKDSFIVNNMPNCPDSTPFRDSHIISQILGVTCAVAILGILC